eukprot:m.71212 g.71212  ORF g.71212 m.71212 type:complete len:77 (-) comp14352_c1_seq1:1036-1266(-)
MAGDLNGDSGRASSRLSAWVTNGDDASGVPSGAGSSGSASDLAPWHFAAQGASLSSVAGPPQRAAAGAGQGFGGFM